MLCLSFDGGGMAPRLRVETGADRRTVRILAGDRLIARVETCAPGFGPANVATRRRRGPGPDPRRPEAASRQVSA